LRRFGAGVGLTLTALLALIGLTPLLDAYLGLVLGAPAEVRAVAASAIGWLLPAPLLLSGQSLARGRLAGARRTGAVGRAMAVHLLVLAGWLTLWTGLDLGGRRRRRHRHRRRPRRRASRARPRLAGTE
jgi:hypothetical protein